MFLFLNHFVVENIVKGVDIASWFNILVFFEREFPCKYSQGKVSFLRFYFLDEVLKDFIKLRNYSGTLK